MLDANMNCKHYASCGKTHQRCIHAALCRWHLVLLAAAGPRMLATMQYNRAWFMSQCLDMQSLLTNVVLTSGCSCPYIQVSTTDIVCATGAVFQRTIPAFNIFAGCTWHEYPVDITYGMFKLPPISSGSLKAYLRLPLPVTAVAGDVPGCMHTCFIADC